MDPYARFREVCQRAYCNDDFFNVFRHNSTYVGIVENVSFESGLMCFPEVVTEFPGLFDKFITNDLIGGPITQYYPQVDKNVSPTTLRYIRILVELQKHFGSLNDLDIIEIGGGYGGQCKIIYDVFKPKSYTIYDFPETLQLIDKFLNCFNIKHVKYLPFKQAYLDSMYLVDMSLFPKYDLCISNYAFAELEKPLRDFYNTLILNQSKKGFLTCNVITKNQVEEFKKEGGEILPEIPLTDVRNFVYTWK